LRLLEFHDGSPHPLASQPCVDIALPTKETHYIGLKTHMSMMGPYIIVAAGLPPEGTGIDVLFLVDWQKGHVTTVSKNVGCSLGKLADVRVPSSTAPRHELISQTSLSCLMMSWHSSEAPRMPSNSADLTPPIRLRPYKPFAFWNSLPSCHTRDSPQPP
jgi:hypothetical protein